MDSRGDISRNLCAFLPRLQMKGKKKFNMRDRERQVLILRISGRKKGKQKSFLIKNGAADET